MSDLSYVLLRAIAQAVSHFTTVKKTFLKATTAGDQREPSGALILLGH